MVGVAVALFCAGLALPAQGAEADKAAAKAHFEAATRLYDVHDYAKALEEYKAAYLAKPDPAFLFNMGQCYKKLGKPAEALEFYRDYLRKAAPDDPNRANIEARVRELESGDLFESKAPPTPAAQPTRPLPPPTVPAYREPAVPPPVAPTYPAATQPAGVDLSTAAPAAPAGQDTAATPFYSTWWFWTGVGAVVVAGTVTAIVLANGGSTTNTANTALGTRGVFQ
jgi:tetratricopeptide (TPR) repeat protein